MKTLIKTFSFIILIMNINLVSAQDAESTLLLTKKGQQIALDFLNSDGVIGLQFDIKLNGTQQKSISLDSCVKGLPSSHIGRCSFVKNGNVRVVVFSTSNAELESGNIGVLDLKASDIKQVSFQNVKMVGEKSRKIHGVSLVDNKDQIGLIRDGNHSLK